MSNYRISPGNKIVKLDSFENEASTEFNFHLISFPFSPPLLHLRISPSTKSIFLFPPYFRARFDCTWLGENARIVPTWILPSPMFLASPLEIRLGTVRFKVDIRHPGFLLKLAANASRRLKLITGGVGEGGPLGVGWKWMKKGNEVTSLEKSYVTRM